MPWSDAVVRRHVAQQCALGSVRRTSAGGSLWPALQAEAVPELGQRGGELGRPEVRSEVIGHHPRPAPVACTSNDGDRLDQPGSTAGKEPVQILDQRRQVRISLSAERWIHLSQQCVRQRLMPSRVARGRRPLGGHHAVHSRKPIPPRCEAPLLADGIVAVD